MSSALTTTLGWWQVPLTKLIDKQDLGGGGATLVDFLQEAGGEEPERR
jgi:hypothetical protein